MTTPCIITVAITGSVPTKADNPAVPITVPEQVESTQASFEAGASDDGGLPPPVWHAARPAAKRAGTMILAIKLRRAPTRFQTGGGHPCRPGAAR